VLDMLVKREELSGSSLSYRTSLLFQKLSISVQRNNARSIIAMQRRFASLDFAIEDLKFEVLEDPEVIENVIPLVQSSCIQDSRIDDLSSDVSVPSLMPSSPAQSIVSNKLSTKLSMAVNVREKLSCLTNNVFTPMVIRRKRLKNRASVGLCLSPVQFFQMFKDDAAKLG